MRLDLGQAIKYLRCPDEGGVLRESREALVCTECERSHPRIGQRVFEILPSSPATFPPHLSQTRYQADYQKFFEQSADLAKDALAWGAPELVNERWAKGRMRHAREVLALLRNGDSFAAAFCDFSGGAGYCSFEAAQMYETVFHCDLSADSLVYSARKAERLGLGNIVFIRSDYFAPPFRKSVCHAVCLDTLIRGEWHELRLLESIRNALTPEGAAVVDFHNWWHNPLRRMGLLGENFAENRSYTVAEFRSLLTRVGVSEFGMRWFVQEKDDDGWKGRILARVMPATRFLVKLKTSKHGWDTQRGVYAASASGRQ